MRERPERKTQFQKLLYFFLSCFKWFNVLTYLLCISDIVKTTFFQLWSLLQICFVISDILLFYFCYICCLNVCCYIKTLMIALEWIVTTELVKIWSTTTSVIVWQDMKETIVKQVRGTTGKSISKYVYKRESSKAL